MIRLLLVKTTLSGWQKGIAISDKLSSETWKLLCLISLGLLLSSILSFQLLTNNKQVIVNDNNKLVNEGNNLETTNTAQSEYNWVFNGASTNIEGWKATYHNLESNSKLPGQALLHTGADYSQENALAPSFYSQRDTGGAVNSIAYSGFSRIDLKTPANLKLSDNSARVVGTNSIENRYGYIAYLNGLFWETPFKYFKILLPPLVFSASMSSSTESGFSKTILFYVTILGLIVSPITSLLTALFTWISLNRKKAEKIELDLKNEKLRLEMELLKIELEKAKQDLKKGETPLIKLVTH